MRKLRIKQSTKPLLTLTRSRRWTNNMVYILAGNKHFAYRDGRSRILYIGTTEKGAGRPAASAVSKASEVFYKLRGVKTIEVHIVTSGKRNKQLEAALLEAFRKRHFQLPKYNKVRPRPTDGLFGDNPLQKLIARFAAS